LVSKETRKDQAKEGKEFRKVEILISLGMAKPGLKARGSQITN